MKTIHKFEINTGENKLQLPKGAKFISTASFGGQLFVWAEIETDNDIECRKISVFGTGWEIPKENNKLVFIGTSITTITHRDYQQKLGSGIPLLPDEHYVWHVFENKSW